MATERIKGIVTGQVEVKWSNLNKLDTRFSDEGVHNITVLLTKELEAHLNAVAKENGVKKINGIYEKDGIRAISFKSNQFAKKGMTKFPCQDATAQYTEEVPWATDVVRLRLGPFIVVKGANKSMSFYLNGVQIVQKNAVAIATTNGFTTVDGGFVGTTAEAPPKFNKEATVGITDDEIPF